MKGYPNHLEAEVARTDQDTGSPAGLDWHVYGPRALYFRREGSLMI